MGLHAKPPPTHTEHDRHIPVPSLCRSFTDPLHLLLTSDPRPSRLRAHTYTAHSARRDRHQHLHVPMSHPVPEQSQGYSPAQTLPEPHGAVAAFSESPGTPTPPSGTHLDFYLVSQLCVCSCHPPRSLVDGENYLWAIRLAVSLFNKMEFMYRPVTRTWGEFTNTKRRKARTSGWRLSQRQGCGVRHDDGRGRCCVTDGKVAERADPRVLVTTRTLLLSFPFAVSTCEMSVR